MKNLANCTPIEFLTQTNKIRKSVASWLSMTKVLDIRNNMPDIPPEATPAERKALADAQARKNLSDMLDAALDEHPAETAELLGLLCFIEPKDLDKCKMSDLLGSFNEILNSEEVISFFTSLVRLVNGTTSATASL